MHYLSDLARFTWAVMQNWGVLVTGGVIVAALNLWSIWERVPVPRKLGLWVAAIFVFFAAFGAWRQQKDLVAQVRSDYDRSSPHLRCEINVIAPLVPFTAYVDGKAVGNFGVIVTPTILNNGSPSTARKFNLMISPQGGPPFIGDPEVIGAPIVHQMDSGPMIIKPSDSLYEKMNTPLPQGGEETGFLLFTFSGIPAYQNIENGAAVKLSFIDVNDKESTCSFVTNPKTSHGVSYLPKIN